MKTEMFAPEPHKTWQRRDYDLALLSGKQPRERAEIETTRDMSKPIEQLVCDSHDMAERVIDENSAPAHVNWCLMQSQKRMVSLMGRVAIEHERNSKWLVWLTWMLGI